MQDADHQLGVKKPYKAIINHELGKRERKYYCHLNIPEILRLTNFRIFCEILT